MTCAHCANGFTYELLIRDEWATFRQWVCVNCGWRFQREPDEVIPERNDRCGVERLPPIMMTLKEDAP